jgi:hypothetical protein
LARSPLIPAVEPGVARADSTELNPDLHIIELCGLGYVDFQKGKPGADSLFD